MRVHSAAVQALGDVCRGGGAYGRSQTRGDISRGTAPGRTFGLPTRPRRDDAAPAEHAHHARGRAGITATVRQAAPDALTSRTPDGTTGRDGDAIAMLGEPHPNPTTGTTMLELTLGQPAYVRVAVYDVLGRLVATVFDGARVAGRHEITFDGSALPAGVYVARVQAQADTRTAILSRRLTVAR